MVSFPLSGIATGEAFAFFLTATAGISTWKPVYHMLMFYHAKKRSLFLYCFPGIAEMKDNDRQDMPAGTAQLTDRLRRHAQMLAGEIGERNIFRPGTLKTAADYIERQWLDQGYSVSSQPYRVRGIESANLEVTRRGDTCPEELLLVGAHYDSVTGSPGANDNASGVAALLEISRMMAQAVPARSVRFVAFTNEESPFFFRHTMGSLVYARAARARGDNIRLMFSLETMAYYRDEPHSQHYPPLFRYFFPNRANFIAFVSNLRSRRLMRRAVDAFRANSNFPSESSATFSWVPGVAWSDHSSFWRQGYPALMITDTAFYRYPYYHARNDTPDKLDYPRLAQVTEGVYHMLYALAQMDKL